MMQVKEGTTIVDAVEQFAAFMDERLLGLDPEGELDTTDAEYDAAKLERFGWAKLISWGLQTRGLLAPAPDDLKMLRQLDVGQLEDMARIVFGGRPQ